MKVGFLVDLTENAYDCIKDAAEKGFDNGQVSVWDMRLYTDEVALEIKRACKDFNFTITAVWCGWSGPVIWSYPSMYQTLGLVPSDYRAKRTEELLLGAEFARKLGVSDIITHIGYLPDNPMHPDNLGVLHALKYICGELKKHGQYFLFETGEELPLSLAHLIRDIGCDNIGINFDPANLILNGRGFCPAQSLRFLAPYIRGIHAKDAKMPVIPNLQKIEVPAGEGDVDFPTLIAILKEIDYKGSVTIEYEVKSDPNRDEQIVKIKKYLDDLIMSK